MTQDVKDDKRGLTPVIAVLILIAIAIQAGVVVFLFTIGVPDWQPYLLAIGLFTAIEFGLVLFGEYKEEKEASP